MSRFWHHSRTWKLKKSESCREEIAHEIATQGFGPAIHPIQCLAHANDGHGCGKIELCVCATVAILALALQLPSLKLQGVAALSLTLALAQALALATVLQ
jgi:hypothetical protein